MLQHGVKNAHFWVISSWKGKNRSGTPCMFNPSYSEHHVIATIFSCMHPHESSKASLDSIVAAATVWDFLSIFNKTWKYRISQLTSSGPNPSQSRVYHSSTIERSAIATRRKEAATETLRRWWRLKELEESSCHRPRRRSFARFSEFYSATDIHAVELRCCMVVSLEKCWGNCWWMLPK